MSKAFADPELLASYYGKRGIWKVHKGITVDVQILKARHVYGRLELLVTPLWGEGKAWTNHKKVILKGGHPGTSPAKEEA